jgi:hypothetical protein
MNKYINLSFRKSLLEETCIPTIFKSPGLRGIEIDLPATGIDGVVKVTAFLLFAADSLGHRRSLLWTALFQRFLMYYIGFYLRFSPPIGEWSVSTG